MKTLITFSLWFCLIAATCAKKCYVYKHCLDELRNAFGACNLEVHGLEENYSFQKFNCYIKCWLEKLDAIRNGTLREEVMRDLMDLDGINVRDAISKCANITGSDDCVAIGQRYNCFREGIENQCNIQTEVAQNS